MISVKFDDKGVKKMFDNAVKYSAGFINELEASEGVLNKKVAEGSIDAFYDYLDGLARSHPGMLHHVYEWGAVGNPDARLFDLTSRMSGSGAIVEAELLQSQVPSESGQIFYDKATVMEEGIPVVINQKNAEALFFEINGEEYFRLGPIYIANPGGQEVRGSFVAAFNEFYGKYFSDVYLSMIRFYQYFEEPKLYEAGFASAVKGGNAYAKGKAMAMSWIAHSPGGI